MNDMDDDAPATGFCKATPELYAKMRQDALDEAEGHVRQFLTESNVGPADFPVFLAEFMRRITELLDAQSAPVLAKVMEQFARDGGVVH